MQKNNIDLTLIDWNDTDPIDEIDLKRLGKVRELSLLGFTDAQIKTIKLQRLEACRKCIFYKYHLDKLFYCEEDGKSLDYKIGTNLRCNLNKWNKL